MENYNMKYLEFHTSIQEEENILIMIFQIDSTFDLKYRIKQYKFPAKLARTINKLPLKNWISNLDVLMDKIYKKDLKKLEKALIFFNSYWEENENNFFSKLEYIFKKEIPKYKILLSRYVAGTSDWKGTNICTNAYSYKWKKENSHIYFLLFEIILSEIFKTIRKNKTEEEISNNEVWIISELTSFTILHAEWNIFNEMKKTYYPVIDRLIPEAKEIYKNSTEIEVFIKKLINLLKISS